MKHRSWVRLALALAILLLTVACDQGTKRWARAHLQRGVPVDVLGSNVQWMLTENRGAFLSLGDRLPEPVRFAVFTALVAVGLAAGLVWLFRARTASLYDVAAVSLLIGGGVGNLIDRALRGGAVTDFVILRLGSLRSGVFNVADMCVTAAVVLLVMRSVIAGERGRPSPSGTPGRTG